MRRLDNSVMEADTDSDVVLPAIFQLRDELSNLDKMVSAEHSTIIFQAIRNSYLSLEQNQLVMIKTIFINNSERKLSATKNNQQSNLRGRENGRESAMSTAITCH